jgi:hypothetical protein
MGRQGEPQSQLRVILRRKIQLSMDLRHDNVINELCAPASAGAHNALIVLSHDITNRIHSPPVR